ncbi:MAG: LUD domain-containing protein [Bacteroidota bacterium]|nr:LUD domain-containing protein [Bacteroidota bacterium]MDP4244593.1 LUD domain-containing protein [Bacteroidota bacterium]MDP4255582.1 LUD domain-containing protein [Bacteroidota bacterium]
MKISFAKENTLKKIRQALSHPTPIPFPNSEGNSSVFQPPTQEPEIEFAEQFTKLLGKFVYCADHRELNEQLRALIINRDWKRLWCADAKWKSILTDPVIAGPIIRPVELSDCDAAITGCELLIARTGSIVMSAADPSGRTGSVYAPVHICIAYTDQLVYDIKDGLMALKEKYAQRLPSLITLATGPSRTADIEKTLVVGVHGPKEAFLFLVDKKL